MSALDELRKRLTAYRDAKTLYESPDPYDREEARYEAMHVAGGRIGHDEALAQALLDEHDALITRLRAAEARTAWQSIETAPRDGSLVLAWHPWWGGADAVRCGRSGVWTADGHPTCEPTHWQPLPAAPEAPHG